MGMTKGEMELHRSEHHALLAKARSALQQGQYREAVTLSVSSWKYVDGMMQYERKYESREFASIESIDLVLKYAPLLFDFQSLDALASLLDSQRRIERNTSVDLADKLSKARAMMWDAHRLWVHLEKNEATRQDELRSALGGDQDRWRSVVEMWEQLGLITRTPDGRSYRLLFATRMGEMTTAKCSACGAVAKARKSRFLEEARCPKCLAMVRFVLLAAARTVNA